MPTDRLHDLPIKRPGVAQNRDDVRSGEGPFVRLVSERAAELVTPNGLVWNGDRQGIVESETSTRRFPRGDAREHGNRAVIGSQGGNDTVNYPCVPGTLPGGNKSGE